MTEQNDNFIFNVLPWQNVTLVQGNFAFFTKICSILKSDTQEVFKEFCSDLEEMIADSEGYNYADCENYSVLRFKELIQVNLSRTTAFAIGEKLQSLIYQLDNKVDPVRVLFAFSKILQASAAGFRPSKRNFENNNNQGSRQKFIR